MGLLVNIINKSIELKLYSITYEITKRFMSDFLKSKRQLPIFDYLFQDFADDTSRYEAKLQIMLRVMPLMNKNLASRFMKIIEVILKEPAEKSIFSNNINPIRVGLTLYRVIDEVQTQYQYSQNSTDLMKEAIDSQLQACLEMFNDPDEVMFMIE